MPVAKPTAQRTRMYGAHEGTSVSQAPLRAVQDHPPEGRGPDHLQQSEAQDEAGLTPRRGARLAPQHVRDEGACAPTGRDQSRPGERAPRPVNRERARRVQMARIAGVDIPRDRRVVASLPVIYGIGPTNARKILERTNVSPDKRVRDLTEEEVNRIREVIDREYIVEGDLRREVNLNIKRLMEIGCYRGIRHRRNLPVHGQRTRTNARMRKGPRRMVAGRLKAAAKK